MKKYNGANRRASCGLNWVKLAQRPDKPNGRSLPFRVVDLFCGCGGMTLGVWEAARLAHRRLDVRLAIDVNNAAIEVFRANFSASNRTARVDDVARVFSAELGTAKNSTERYWTQKVGKVDLLVAGPPCQGHSDLNNSTRRNDPRNQLYLRVVRACQVLRPRVVIIENVPAVLHDRGKVVEVAKACFQASDYHVSDGCVQLGNFGLPQSRKRHILIAVAEGQFELSDVKATVSSPPIIADYLKGLEKEPERMSEIFFRPSQVTETNQERIDYLFDHELHDLPDEMRPYCHREKDHAYVSMYGRMHKNKPAQTLTSGFGSMGQGRYVHPTQRRLLTPHEAARIQGFPDFFDFSAAKTISALREMIANVVPPQFTTAVLSQMFTNGVL